MNNPSYIPLFNSTSLSKTSILNSKSMIEHGVKNGLLMMGICERMNFFSMLDFAKLAKTHKIKPVFACIINALWEGKIFGDLVFFIKNQRGFDYFSKTLSNSYINHNFMKDNCYVHLEDLWECEDLIMVIPKNNVLHQNIMNNEVELCQDFLIKLRDKMKNNIYLAIDLIEEPNSFLNKLIPLGDNLNIPLIYYHSPLFSGGDERLSYYIFDCIINKKQYDEDVFQNMGVESHSFLSQSTIESNTVVEEALWNTYYLGLRCNFMPKKNIPRPPYFIESPQEEKRIFTEKAEQGLSKLIQNRDEEKIPIYFARLKMELEVILSKNFAGYFLIVADFVQWAKINQVPVGAGRGSGAGSIVAWSLGITEVDPLQFDLLFERFLNPERASMPDFDIDFCPKKRDKVLEYVINKYGIYHCAHIITFGLMKAKMVVRDVGRVLGLSYYDVDKIAKIIPNDQIRPVKLADVLQNDHRLQNIYQEEPKIKKLIDISLTLEGLPRSISVHAAGFIISNENLYTYAPYYLDREDGQLCLQLNMHQVEEVGLIKFDFLCLKTLTICQEIKELVWDTRGIMVEMDNHDFQNKEAYELMGTGRCSGIFQLESSGIQEEVVQMKPDNINDIIALISLFRPGPIAYISHYIRRKHGLEEVHYGHPILESILKSTYGVIVYQEQVMEITRVMAGYSLSRADLVRKAMGKKKPEEMIKQEIEFLEGAVKNGIPHTVAKHTFEQISVFAGYAFNKAHAASYAIITYNTAYLKAHYMEEFYTVILNNDINDSSKILTFILEFRKFNGIVQAPEINRSEELFIVSGPKSILYGLTAVRGVGNYGKKIFQERVERGEYKSYQDFLYRNKEINKKVLKALVYSGAFDIFDNNRCRIMRIGEIFLETKFAVINTMEKRRWSAQRTILNEQEAFGFFLGRSPIDVYGTILKARQIRSLGELLYSIQQQKEVTMRCAAILEEVKKRKTPSGVPYAFLSIMDGNHNVEVTAFSKVLTEKYDILVENNLIIFTIQARREGEKIRFSVRDLQSIEEFLSNTHYSLKIQTNGEEVWGPGNSLQGMMDLLVRDNQSISHNEPRPSQHKNVDIIFVGHYITYHLPHFLSHDPNFTEQLDLLSLNYNYGL